MIPFFQIRRQICHQMMKDCLHSAHQTRIRSWTFYRLQMQHSIRFSTLRKAVTFLSVKVMTSISTMDRFNSPIAHRSEIRKTFLSLVDRASIGEVIQSARIRGLSLWRGLNLYNLWTIFTRTRARRSIRLGGSMGWNETKTVIVRKLQVDLCHGGFATTPQESLWIP